MCMRSVVFLSRCLFPPRCSDLYLQLLVAAPQTLITGNPKHVTEPEWIWKGRACRLGSGNLLRSRQWWTVQYMHASRELPGGGSTLSRADGLPLRCKGQRVYWAEILWVCVTDWKGEVHSTSRHTKGLFCSKQERYDFLSGVATAPGVHHPGLEEGLHFTDGRAVVGCGLSAWGFWLRDLVSVLEKRCGMWKTVSLTMCSWLKKKEKNYIFSPQLIRKCAWQLLELGILITEKELSTSEDKTGLNINFSLSSKVKDYLCQSCFQLLSMQKTGRAANFFFFAESDYMSCVSEAFRLDEKLGHRSSRPSQSLSSSWCPEAIRLTCVYFIPLIHSSNPVPHVIVDTSIREKPMPLSEQEYTQHCGILNYQVANL